MQTRSRSKPDKVVSYVEVDSDIDIDSEEEKLVSEFKGLSVKNNEGKKDAKSKARKGRRAFTSKLLLDLPFDEFEIVCSHLEGRDLAHLVRVNKQLFNDLRGNSSIWREARKRDGYVLLDGMSEFGFGMLTWDDRCQECSSRKDVERDFHLRVCLCGFHRREMLFQCTRAGLERLPRIHSHAHHCVPRSVPLSARCNAVLMVQLELMSDELFDAESRDESRKATTSSRRNSEVDEPSDATSFVKQLIEERSRSVQAQKKVADINLEIMRRTTRERRAARQEIQEARWKAEREQELAQLEAKRVQLSSFGWTEEEVNFCEDDQWFKKYKMDSPRVAETVAQQLNLVQGILASEGGPPSENKSYHNYRARQEEVKIRYNSLRAKAFSEDERDIFPDWWDIHEHPKVKALYESKISLVTDDIWNAATPAIYKIVLKVREQRRIQLIRVILQATATKKLNLSLDPADYPPDTYDRSFFSLATSALMYWTVRNGVCNGIGLGVYPEVFNPDHRKPFTDTCVIRSIRLILKAARLNPAIATLDDLKRKSAEGHWLWINSKDLALRTTPLDLETLHDKLRSIRTLSEFEKIKLRYISN